jgi:hypothetical protein
MSKLFPALNSSAKCLFDLKILLKGEEMEPTLKIEEMIIRSADLNVENSLPSILPVLNVQTQKTISLDEDDEIFFDIGKIRSIYPYTQQDLYDRPLAEKKYRSVVLENDYLKAVFLPEIGGRLWSLYDKVEGRELLYVNDCVRFCNLALRNAWFSGGVEWNIGMIGHTPFTCSPLFASVLESGDGTPERNISDGLQSAEDIENADMQDADSQFKRQHHTDVLVEQYSGAGDRAHPCDSSCGQCVLQLSDGNRQDPDTLPPREGCLVSGEHRMFDGLFL